MALSGIAILAYTLYAYISQVRLEAELTAQIPGQNTDPSITNTPVVLLPFSDDVLPTRQAMPSFDDASPTRQAIPSFDDLTPTRRAPVSASDTPSLAPTRTLTALTPRTPEPTEEISNLLNRATATRIPTTILAGVRVPTAMPGMPTIDPNSPRPVGEPRGSGSPATRLQIPKLHMDLAVVAAGIYSYQQNNQIVSDWTIPFNAAGHLTTTVQPGEIGNAVISGHHNLVAPDKFGLGVFAGLWNLAIGDEIHVDTADGKVQLWRVKETFPIKEGGEPLAVRIRHAQQIMADTPEPILTLLTCWNGQSNPLSGNTYRWIVRAELVNVN